MLRQVDERLLFCSIGSIIEIPHIEIVRVKTEPIPEQLINPTEVGDYFPSAVGPRVVYLDQRYDYPPQTGNDVAAERDRQAGIWRQFRSGGDWGEFLDRQVEAETDEATIRDIKADVADQLDRTSTAEYFERVFSRLFQEQIEVVIISTGIRPFDGSNYHYIGYLPN